VRGDRRRALWRWITWRPTSRSAATWSPTRPGAPPRAVWPSPEFGSPRRRGASTGSATSGRTARPCSSTSAAGASWATTSWNP